MIKKFLFVKNFTDKLGIALRYSERGFNFEGEKRRYIDYLTIKNKTYYPFYIK